MEDSRNIIKAIDNLTFSIVGSKKDSKNITHAIDNLYAGLKTDLQRYISDDGLIIYRIGRIAQLAALPSVTTTSQNALVAKIDDVSFRPSSRVWFATKVYDGSKYTDCFIEMKNDGTIALKSPSNSVVAGYQANFTQCLGLTFIANG